MLSSVGSASVLAVTGIDNMPNQFPWQWTWLQCERTLDTTTGDNPRTYVANATPLWGSAELQSASVENEYGRPAYIVTGQVRFRQQIAINQLDRLTLIRDNMTFVIDGIRFDWDNNQTIVDIHSLTTQ